MPHASRAVADDWMRHIDDSRYLSELSIPGTHDSLTDLVQGNSVITQGFARCQDLSLAEQLRRGIRFVDVRLRYAPDLGPALMLCHGAGLFGVDMGYEFCYAVRDVCRAFLSEHPSETIVMSVKNEDEKHYEQEFADLFASYVTDPAQSALWYTGRIVPTLGATRGKIVLMRRYAKGPLGIDATHWPENEPFRFENPDHVKFDVQDEFRSYSPSNRKVKFEKYVLKTLTDAIRDTDSRKLFINFTSGTGSVWPKTLAETVNAQVYQYFRYAMPGRYGMIPMDYPEQFAGTGNDLIAAIVSTNPCDKPSAQGVYELRPKLAPNSALTVSSNGFDVGIYQTHPGQLWPVPQWVLPPGDRQKWRLTDAGGGHFNLQPLSAQDKTLTVADAAKTDGSRIVLSARSGRDEQAWKLTRLSNGLFRVNPKHAPGYVLDVYGAHKENDSPVKLYHYYDSQPGNDGSAQRWVLVRVA